MKMRIGDCSIERIRSISTEGSCSRASFCLSARGSISSAARRCRSGALSNEKRLAILGWLRDPVEHFPPQTDGDLVKDGVCGLFIAEKLGVSQPTASEHLRMLTEAGLLQSKRIKQWTFYKRDEKRIREIKKVFASL